MRIRVLCGALLVLAGMLPGLSQTQSSFPGTIILGNPTDRSITVNTRANASLEVYFDYGVKSATYTGKTQPVVSSADPYAGGFFVAQSLINGLQPDTRYYYRIQYRAAGSSGAYTAGAENSFNTQRVLGSPFVFCAQGDSHPERANSMFNSSLYTRTLTAVAAEKPDFYIASGDDFSVDTLQPPYTSASVSGRYTLQLPYFDILSRASSLFLVNGNHEQASLSNYNRPPDANNSNQVPIWAQNARNLYYPSPAPNDAITGTFYSGNTAPVAGIGLLRNYYAWHWGDALFVVIDPYWASTGQVDSGLGGQNSATPKATGWAVTHGDAQYQWLKQTLEQSKARWKFVFAHHVMGSGRGAIELAPYYEWGGLNNNGSQGFAANRPGWAMPIHQLMVANNVTIFFQGHDHLFARQQLDGVTYQELPSPADNTYTAFNADAYKSGDKFPNSGYVKVTVSPSSVLVQYIRMFLPQDERPPQTVSGMVQFSYTIQARGSSQAALAVGAGGAGYSQTLAADSSVQAGYATATIQSGSAPYGTAVFSLSQEGVAVSEAGVPASPPTTAARLFVDYGMQVSAGPARLGAGPVDVFTGIAVVNPGNTTASVTYTLRDMQGRSLAVGHGTLAAGAHRARFLQELAPDLAADFVLPPGFAATARYGSLEVASNQPLSVLALRMTVNQRGNTLFTSVPVADLTRAASTGPLYFPQVADGDGYTTTLILLNTTGGAQTGSIRFYSDDGSPLVVSRIGGTSDSAYRYAIPAGGAYLLQTDGAPVTANVGSVQLVPDAGTTTPLGAGLFSRTSGGYLATESGVAASTPTNHARVYVDLSGGHDSGLAIAAPEGGAVRVTLRAYQADGVTAAGTGSATLDLSGNGHRAAFVGQWIGGLPANFRGVVDISAPAAFAALTLRSLVNGRGDFLLTTFPVADLTRPAPGPLVFPQIADGGGYQTEFILLSSGNAAAATLSLFADDGSPLPVIR